MFMVCLIVIYLACLQDAQPVTLSFPFLNRMKWENKMENLMGQDKDREITYWLV